MCSEEDLYRKSLSIISSRNQKKETTSFIQSKMEVALNEVRKVNDGVSPEAWSTNSDSPTPIANITESPWKQSTVWQGTLGDEHRLLLATEEESSDRHSSDEDVSADLESIYSINNEQLEYYKKQFYIIQPDDRGLVSGQSAKMFFEKSTIPIEELRHIWQICDVTKDGALSLPEFVAAMHLVVLRRNSMPLPQMLPTCLDPDKVIQIESFEGQAANASHLLNFDEKKICNLCENESIDRFENSFAKIKIDLNSSLKIDRSNPVNAEENESLKITNLSPAKQLKSSSPRAMPEEWTNQNRKWTKFPESPTAFLPNLKQKPVHFDLQKTAQAVVSDPQILHPVALRLSPVDTLQSDYIQTCSAQAIISPRSSETAGLMGKQCNFENISTANICLNVGVNYVACENENSVVITKPEKSSVVLPNKSYRHLRSCSLDLNKLKLSHFDSVRTERDAFTTNDDNMIAQNNLPQRIWNTMDTKNTAKMHTTTPLILPSLSRLPQHFSAFEVYKKPATNRYKKCSTIVSEMLRSSSNIQAENVVDILGCLKQRNTFLLSLCKNLSMELLSMQQLKDEIHNKINFASILSDEKIAS